MSSIDARRAQLGREAAATPVRETSVDENKVVVELRGWYKRYCMDRAAEEKDLQKRSSYGVNSQDTGVSLTARLAAGEHQSRIDGWVARATAAENGVFLFDQAALRNPAFMADASIRGLRERASSLGLVAYENESQPLGDRY